MSVRETLGRWYNSQTLLRFQVLTAGLHCKGSVVIRAFNDDVITMEDGFGLTLTVNIRGCTAVYSDPQDASKVIRRRVSEEQVCQISFRNDTVSVLFTELRS